MSRIARNISGNRSLGRTFTTKELNAKRKLGVDTATDTIHHKQKVSKRYVKEAQVNAARPVALLKGFFQPQAETICKTFSQDELKKLNEERGLATTPVENPVPEYASSLFNFEELQEMAEKCYDQDIWLTPKLQEYPLKDMSDDHIINCIFKLKREKGQGCWGFGNLWWQKFVDELKYRGVTLDGS